MSTIDIKEKIQDYLEIADDNILEIGRASCRERV